MLKRELTSNEDINIEGLMNKSLRKGRNKKLSSTSDIRDKHLMSYGIGVPVFLTKAKNPILKHPYVESTIMEARKRYEELLEKARKEIIESGREVKERNENVNKVEEFKIMKQKMNIKDTQKYLELQMEQKVD